MKMSDSLVWQINKMLMVVIYLWFTCW